MAGDMGPGSLALGFSSSTQQRPAAPVQLPKLSCLCNTTAGPLLSQVIGRGERVRSTLGAESLHSEFCAVTPGKDNPVINTTPSPGFPLHPANQTAAQETGEGQIPGLRVPVFFCGTHFSFSSSLSFLALPLALKRLGQETKGTL